MVGLYRCYTRSVGSGHLGKHFVTTSSNCDGYTIEGIYGYVYTSQATGTRPLYRMYHAWTGDHFTTYDLNGAVAAGYTYVSVLGYVP